MFSTDFRIVESGQNQYSGIWTKSISEQTAPAGFSGASRPPAVQNPEKKHLLEKTDVADYQKIIEIIVFDTKIIDFDPKSSRAPNLHQNRCVSLTFQIISFHLLLHCNPLHIKAALRLLYFLCFPGLV